MKIAILSCFYPFRGGISQFNASLFSELSKTETVKAFNFTRQYPEFLFPGKTQYVTPDDEAVPIESESLLDTANPFTWGPTYKAIRDWKPDLVIMSWWMFWFAPSLGTIARRLKKHCPVVSVLHNVISHDARFFEKPLINYFLSSCTAHVVLSEEVGNDLQRLQPGAKMIELFHPIYDHFGEKLERSEALSRLGLEEDGKKNLLFFGLIRDYKGLDILLDAFSGLDDSYRLIVAGEPYGSFEKYQKMIDASPAKERIHLYLDYIKDSRVKDFFSAADLTVLPYRSATQSGISAISYHFEVPMVVTDVGGLKEAVEGAGTGLVAEKAEAGCIKENIIRFFENEDTSRQCHISIRGEKARLSWHTFGRQFMDFVKNLDQTK